jgi:hypothetical protein
MGGVCWPERKPTDEVAWRSRGDLWPPSSSPRLAAGACGFRPGPAPRQVSLLAELPGLAPARLTGAGARRVAGRLLDPFPGEWAAEWRRA